MAYKNRVPNFGLAQRRKFTTLILWGWFVMDMQIFVSRSPNQLCPTHRTRGPASAKEIPNPKQGGNQPKAYLNYLTIIQGSSPMRQTGIACVQGRCVHKRAINQCTCTVF